jgi:BlaI family penicillinase repressor
LAVTSWGKSTWGLGAGEKSSFRGYKTTDVVYDYMRNRRVNISTTSKAQASSPTTMKNESLPRISDAEWEVMLLLWEQSPLTAANVVATLAPVHNWNERTVKTLLSRLVKKGALSVEPDGKRYLYSAAVSRDACVRRESRTFLDRVFGGSASPMLAHFVREGGLNEKQIKELRSLLDEVDDKAAREDLS